MDVLGAAYGISGDVTWWENTDSDGTNWTRHDVNDDIIEPRSVHAADIDGDGDMDVLVAAEWGDCITWWENNFVIPGDFEPDEDVDFSDLDVLSKNWLKTGCGPCDCNEVDLTCDGAVDFADFAILALHWLAGK